MRVLIAPDSFKGSLDAAAVAAALAKGWLGVRPRDQVTRLPLADGGEGTLDVLAATVPEPAGTAPASPGQVGAPVIARWLELPLKSSGQPRQRREMGFPGGSPARGQYSAPRWPAVRPAPVRRGSRAAATPRGLPRLGAKTAVVELARASGLPLLARPDPMRAQTTGLGELLGRALDTGVGKILVGLGGSASTTGDGSTGRPRSPVSRRRGASRWRAGGRGVGGSGDGGPGWIAAAPASWGDVAPDRCDCAVAGGAGGSGGVRAAEGGGSGSRSRGWRRGWPGWRRCAGGS